jgi:hypothetical protein
MNQNFTYIIRSNDREEPIDDSNNCTIQLNGLPQQYRHFKCDVIALYLTTVGEVLHALMWNYVQIMVWIL